MRAKRGETLEIKASAGHTSNVCRMRSPKSTSLRPRPRCAPRRPPPPTPNAHGRSCTVNTARSCAPPPPPLGPWTSARTCVLPMATKAWPSAAERAPPRPSLQSKWRASAARRPSTRSPSGLRNSSRDMNVSCKGRNGARKGTVGDGEGAVSAQRWEMRGEHATKGPPFGPKPHNVFISLPHSPHSHPNPLQRKSASPSTYLPQQSGHRKPESWCPKVQTPHFALSIFLCNVDCCRRDQGSVARCSGPPLCPSGRQAAPQRGPRRSRHRRRRGRGRRPGCAVGRAADADPQGCSGRCGSGYSEGKKKRREVRFLSSLRLAAPTGPMPLTIATLLLLSLPIRPRFNRLARGVLPRCLSVCSPSTAD